MMEYSNFYDIAEYINGINRNVFSAREMAETAYTYCSDFEWSKANGEVAHNLKELAKLLAEDNSDECKDWLYEMATELGLLDMDFMDYMESDEDIISCVLAKKETNTETIRISGVIFEHGANDCGLWEGFVLSKEDENAIQTILSKYDTEGCSVRGTKSEIAKEFSNETVEDLSKSYGVIDLLIAAIMRNNNLSYDKAEEIALRLNSSDYLFDRIIEEYIEEEE